MELTLAHIAAAKLCGFRILPATSRHIAQFPYQRRLFRMDGQPHVITREGSFFETWGTFLSAIEKLPPLPSDDRITAAATTEHQVRPSDDAEAVAGLTQPAPVAPKVADRLNLGGGGSLGAGTPAAGMLPAVTQDRPVQALYDAASAAGSTAPRVAPPRPGRPPELRNQITAAPERRLEQGRLSLPVEAQAPQPPTSDEQVIGSAGSTDAHPPARRRGRPLGSKNKTPASSDRRLERGSLARADLTQAPFVAGETSRAVPSQGHVAAPASAIAAAVGPQLRQARNGSPPRWKIAGAARRGRLREKIRTLG